MGTGDNDSRPAWCFGHFNHIDLESLPDTIAFIRHPLVRGQYRFNPAEVNQDLSGFDTLDDTADNVTGLAGIFFKNSAVLRFMQTLENNLLGSLRSNTAGILRCRFYHN